jgi:hypothetical protein
MHGVEVKHLWNMKTLFYFSVLWGKRETWYQGQVPQQLIEQRS